MVAKKLVEARDLGKRDKKSPTIRPASFREHPLDPDGLAHAMLPAAALLVGAAAWAPHRVVPALWQPHQCPACTPSGRADSAARTAPGHVRMVEQPIAFRGLRRRAYEVLAPLDRGDFRWEFLVPWTNKTLSTTDKFIVCSVFIGLSFTLQSVFDEGASVGVHLSYIAQFFSYAMGDPIGFRLLAVLTSILEIGGNLLEENSGGLFVGGLRSDWWIPDTEDVFPVLVRAVGIPPATPCACPWGSLDAALAGSRVVLTLARPSSRVLTWPLLGAQYNQFFIVINAYYILRWLLNREALVAALDWPQEGQKVYTDCFAQLGFNRAQFSRLLAEASFESAEDDTEVLICVQVRPGCPTPAPARWHGDPARAA